MGDLVERKAVSRMIRLMFVATALHYGGSERFLYLLLKNLDPQQFEVHLALVNRRGFYLDKLPAHIHIHTILGRRVRYALPGLVYLVEKIRPDILFSSLSGANSLTVLARDLLPRFKRPKVVIREGTIARLDDTAFISPMLTRFVTSLPYHRADVVIANANYLKQSMVDYYRVKPERIMVFHNPVSIDDGSDVTVLPEPIERFFARPGFKLISVGHLKRAKAHLRMLSVMEALRERTNEFALLILGDDFEKLNLNDEIQKRGLADHVVWHPFFPRPHALVKRSDLFIMTSIYEGFPNALAEAAMNGTPVIAFEAPGGFRDIVKEGVNGYLIPDGDITGMADRIAAMIQQRTVFSRERVRETMRPFEISTIVPRYMGFFQALATNQPFTTV